MPLHLDDDQIENWKFLIQKEREIDETRHAVACSIHLSFQETQRVVSLLANYTNLGDIKEVLKKFDIDLGDEYLEELFQKIHDK